MFAFFPRSYPDETIYSLISRYLEIENITFTQFQWILNNQVAATTMHVLPVSLDRLAAKLPWQWKKDAERLLNEHTVFRYYRPFNSATKVADWTNLAMKEGPMAAAKLGYWKRSAPLRFCPGCVKHDIAQGREPYFRCSHHIIGSPACAEHGFLLETIKHRGGLPFIPLAKTAAVKKRLGRTAPWKLVRLAHDIEYCVARWQDRSSAEILQAIETKLLNRGSLSLSVVPDSDQKIKTYISGIAQYLPPIFRTCNPLREVASGQKYAGQPYHNLLLIRAMGLNPKTLFLQNDETGKRRSTWCANPSCKSYNRIVPVCFEVYEPAWQQHVSVRCLECGFAYLSQKETLFAKQPPKKPRIIDLGKRLNDKFRALWMNSELSYKDIAKAMQFPPGSTSLFCAARANNLPIDRNGAQVPPSRMNALVKTWKTQGAKFEASRKALQKLKDKFPGLTVSQARALNPKACNIVFPHDFIWWANLFGLPDNRRLHPLIEHPNRAVRFPVSEEFASPGKSRVKP